MARPQWSPSAGDGTTRDRHDRRQIRCSGRNGARPLGTGRPLRRNRRTLMGCRRNGARPLGTGRHGGRGRSPGGDAAAMEPVRWGRDDEHGTVGSTGIARACRNGARPLGTGRLPFFGFSTRSPMRRNGARPLGTGRLLRVNPILNPSNRPQWSPSAGDGTTLQPGRRRPVAGCAAMEPVRWGRDDPLAATSRVVCMPAAMEPVRWGRDDAPGRGDRPGPPAGRNGARPLGTGRLTRWSRPPAPSSSRNGARPLGTGRLRGGGEREDKRIAAMEPVRWGRDDPHPTREGRHRRTVAAMEPVRWGRDDTMAAAVSVWAQMPQWSPSAGDGTTGTICAGMRSTNAPQWSPSAGDGTTRPVKDKRGVPVCGRNGARPLGTGRRGASAGSAGAAAGGRNGARPLGTGRHSMKMRIVDVRIAAMEPVRWGRDDLSPRAHARWLPGRRNGARPLGTGRRRECPCSDHLKIEPQWSPSAGDGTTPPAGVVRVLGHQAAMEPVRWGRDDTA